MKAGFTKQTWPVDTHVSNQFVLSIVE